MNYQFMYLRIDLSLLMYRSTTRFQFEYSLKKVSVEVEWAIVKFSKIFVGFMFPLSRLFADSSLLLIASWAGDGAEPNLLVAA